MERPAFLSQKAPPNYVAGVGRGATGFTTRSDIGSGKIPSRLQDKDQNRSAGDGDEVDDEPLRNRGNAFLDSFGMSLASGKVDDEDDEADRIFKSIDESISSRNKAKAKIDDTTNTRINDISGQFQDLKRSLATVSDAQWENIPEAGDITRRNKRQRLEMQSGRKTYAAPDALVAGNVNLTKLTEEREKLLGLQIDENLPQNTGDATIEDQDELKALLAGTEDPAVFANYNDQVEDVKKMRLILNSYRKSDPKKPQGWIACARLEEKARRFRIAKSLIEEGLQHCPRDEDIWLECLRLNAVDNEYCKNLVADGISFNQKSLRLWLKAIELEKETINKVRVLRKAIRNLPECEQLWKMAVEYEDQKDQAIQILMKAVEVIPNSIDLLFALVNLQEHSAARKTLNEARKRLPTEAKIWVLAAQLEERSQFSSFDKLTKLLIKGIKEVASQGQTMSFQDWIALAEATETEFGQIYLQTVRAIVRAATLTFDKQVAYDSVVRLVERLSDELWITKGSLYHSILTENPGKLKLWRKFIDFSRDVDKMDDVYRIFDEVLFGSDQSNIYNNAVLVLMYSKELWKNGGNAETALQVLNRGLEVSQNVDFWLAKTKLLACEKRYQEAETTFEFAIEQTETHASQGIERLYYRHVSFLRFMKEQDKCFRLLEQRYIPKRPTCEKLYLQLGQIYCERKDYQRASESYSRGYQRIPSSIHLCIAVAEIEEMRLNQPTIARSKLDLAMLKIPNSPELHVAKARMESRLYNQSQAALIVIEALKRFPTNAALWVENLKLVTKKSLRRTMFQEALKKTSNDYRVLHEIGLNFYKDAQYEKAVKWFDRVTQSNLLFGDSWLYLYKCYKRLQKDTSSLIKKINQCEPRYGSEWIRVAKDVRFQFLKPSEMLETWISHNGGRSRD
ncbi:LAMI_0C05622g1_1 [Lachancea mirantina]|uniref:LAMI_0C05622g1_1 n=1 Tax=Lachancea mirantina TaxID=1230905 RepID=A0A1G4J324_9SACH|nr:LAMI_0C05622g1_1 [Lachancea mirantina]